MRYIYPFNGRTYFFSEYKETVLGECVLEQKSFVLLNSNGYKTIICLFRFIQKATKNIQNYSRQLKSTICCFVMQNSKLCPLFRL